MKANAVYPVLKLNALEAEILLHRLESSDAIADVLTDYAEGERPLTICSRETIEDVCKMMVDELRANGTILLSVNLRRLIFADAIEGNTALCDVDEAMHQGEITRSNRDALKRAAKSLHAKAVAAGIKCDAVPLW